MSQLENLGTLEVIIYARREDENKIADFINIYLSYFRENCKIPVSSISITQPSYDTFIYFSLPCKKCELFNTDKCEPTKLNALNTMNVKTELERKIRHYLLDKEVKKKIRSVGCRLIT